MEIRDRIAAITTGEIKIAFLFSGGNRTDVWGDALLRDLQGRGGQNRMTTIERAFEIARGGDARTITAIRAQLNKEGFDAVQSHLSSGALKKQLQAAIQRSRAAQGDTASP